MATEYWSTGSHFVRKRKLMSTRQNNLQNRVTNYASAHHGVEADHKLVIEIRKKKKKLPPGV